MLFLVVSHECFEFIRVVGDTLLAHEATAVLRDQQVVLDTDTAKVLIGLELVEVQELSTMAFLPPEVDKVGDEVDAWFVGDNESFLQASAHTQTVCPKLLQIRTCLLVEADIDLSETFHIVYVHTHHVSQSMRQEHRMGTGSYSLVGVALHQAELFQPFRHQTADGKVHIGIFHTGLGHFEHIVVTGFNDGVYLQLAL